MGGQLSQLRAVLNMSPLASAALLFTLLAPATVFAGKGRHGGISSRPSFSDYDANGDSVVTLAEVEAKLPELAADGAAQNMINLFDTNGDGVLDEVEFGDARTMAEETDENGDGVIDDDEYEKGADKATKAIKAKKSKKASR